MPIVKFQVTDVPGMPLSSEGIDLSKDQKYLLEMCNAVSAGVCPPSLVNLYPGWLNHARWLTTANRILRLYVVSVEPSGQLIALTTFIMKVYTPTWFNIKRNSSYIHGPKNLWSMIFRSRYLSDDLKAVIDPILQRNAFFAHQENILVAMLHDSRKHIRELALKRIMVARNQQEPSSDPREFKVPKLNFHARDYTDMIDF